MCVFRNNKPSEYSNLWNNERHAKKQWTSLKPLNERIQLIELAELYTQNCACQNCMFTLKTMQKVNHACNSNESMSKNGTYQKRVNEVNLLKMNEITNVVELRNEK